MPTLFYIILILFACELFLLFIWRWKKNNQPFYKEDGEILMGHRGSPTLVTENTIPSFQKALDQGADGIELDIRLSKDGKVIVFHDEDLMRLADQKDRIQDITLDELKKIKLKKIKDQIEDATIPALDDIIPLLPRMRVINIEIKSEKFYEDLKILDHLASFIAKTDISSKCIVSSFNPYLLYKLKKKYPKIIQGFLYSGYKSLVYNLFWMLLCRPDNLHINHRAINPFIRWWAKHKGLYINVYTVNDCDTYHSLQQSKLDGIFSDNIEYLK